MMSNRRYPAIGQTTCISPVLAVLIVATSLFMVGCDRQHDTSTSSSEFGQNKTPDASLVVIINLLSHPILNNSISGIRAALSPLEKSGRVRVTELNANGEMDKLALLAREAVRLKPRVIVPVSTPVTQTVVKEASESQDILFSTVTNPDDVGMNSTHPNISGVSDVVDYRANIDLIFQLFPNTKVIGMVHNPGEANSMFGVDFVRRIAKERGFELKLAIATKSTEVSGATKSLMGNVDVIYVGSDNTVVAAIASLTKVAGDNRIPVIASDVGSVEGGALAAVSVDYQALGTTAGEMVKALVNDPRKRAGSMPVVRVIGDSLILNALTAKEIGVSFPESLTSRAAKVIH